MKNKSIIISTLLLFVLLFSVTSLVFAQLQSQPESYVPASYVYEQTHDALYDYSHTYDTEHLLKQIDCYVLTPCPSTRPPCTAHIDLSHIVPSYRLDWTLEELYDYYLQRAIERYGLSPNTSGWRADCQISFAIDAYGVRLSPTFTEVYGDAPLERAIAAAFGGYRSVEYIAHLDFDGEMRHVQNLIVRARAEVVLGDIAWVADGYEAIITRADGTVETPLKFSEVFPGWDLDVINDHFIQARANEGVQFFGEYLDDLNEMAIHESEADIQPFAWYWDRRRVLLPRYQYIDPVQPGVNARDYMHMRDLIGWGQHNWLRARLNATWSPIRNPINLGIGYINGRIIHWMPNARNNDIVDVRFPYAHAWLAIRASSNDFRGRAEIVGYVRWCNW